MSFISRRRAGLVFSIFLIIFCAACHLKNGTGNLTREQHTAAVEAVRALQKARINTLTKTQDWEFALLLKNAEVKVVDAQKLLPDGELKIEITAAYEGFKIVLRDWKEAEQARAEAATAAQHLDRAAQLIGL